jgi:hypothetical protein
MDLRSAAALDEGWNSTTLHPLLPFARSPSKCWLRTARPVVLSLPECRRWWRCGLRSRGASLVAPQVSLSLCGARLPRWSPHAAQSMQGVPQVVL